MRRIFRGGAKIAEMKDGMYVQTYHKDCVIISIANYTGKSYDDVLRAAEMCGAKNVHQRGTPTNLIPVIILMLTGKMPKHLKPRRGQDKLTGILSWHKPNAKSGHSTACIDGIVFDTDGRQYPIADYRRIMNFNLRGYYGGF